MGPALKTQAYVNLGIKVDDAVLYGLLKLGFRNTKGGVNFVEGQHKVIAGDLHVVEVVGDAGDGSNLCSTSSR